MAGSEVYGQRGWLRVATGGASHSAAVAAALVGYGSAAAFGMGAVFVVLAVADTAGLLSVATRYGTSWGFSYSQRAAERHSVDVYVIAVALSAHFLLRLDFDVSFVLRSASDDKWGSLVRHGQVLRTKEETQPV